MEKQDLYQTLIQIAKNTIKDKLEDTNTIDRKKLEEQFEQLCENYATFVTLNINGKLRGCIGSLVAYRSLFDDIVSNAKSAAFNDNRFQSLSKEEFKNTKIEISIISEIEHIEYFDTMDLETKIIPNKHGVILKKGNSHATFLPQVWEQLPTFDAFLVNLFEKAGLKNQKENAMSLENNTAEIYTYTVQKIQEE